MAETKTSIKSVAPIWDRITREEEEAVQREPLMGGLLHACLLNHHNIEKALSYRLAYDEHLHHGWLEELKRAYLGLVRAKWPEDPRDAERTFEDTLRSAR